MGQPVASPRTNSTGRTSQPDPVEPDSDPPTPIIPPGDSPTRGVLYGRCGRCWATDLTALLAEWAYAAAGTGSPARRAEPFLASPAPEGEPALALFIGVGGSRVMPSAT